MNEMIKLYRCIPYGLKSKILTSILIFNILLPIIYQAFSPTVNAGMRKTFTPRISISSQYDDNIELASENEISDLITMFSPGFSLNLDSPKTKLGMDYETRLAFYKRDSSRDNVLHNGTAQWEQQLSRNLKLEITDTFSRSDDPILVGEEGRLEVIERRIYYRNNGQIGLSLRFGVDSSVDLFYRNHYFDNKSTRYEDSLGHEFFFNLDTMFNPLFGIGLESRINRGRFKQPEGFTGEGTDDFYDYEGVITLNYRWHPSRRLFARYSLLAKKYDDPTATEFWLHQGSLGLNYVLSPNTNFSAEGGYFLRDFPKGRKSDDGARFNIILNTQKRKATVSLGGSGGYTQYYFSAENLGSSEFQQVFGSVDYFLSENLRTLVFANYRRNDFFGEGNQKNREDDVWRTSVRFNFLFSNWFRLLIEASRSERESERKSTDPAVPLLLTKVRQTNVGFNFLFSDWLRLSIEASRSEQESTHVEEFIDNRVMLRLTVAYPILF